MSDDFLDDIINDVEEKIQADRKEVEDRLTGDPAQFMLDRVDKLTLLDTFSKREEVDPEKMMKGMLGAVHEVRDHLIACVKETGISHQKAASGDAPANFQEVNLPASFRSLIWALQLLDIMIHTMTHPKSEDPTVRYFYYADQLEHLRKMVRDIYNDVEISKIGDDLYLSHKRSADDFDKYEGDGNETRH